MEVVVAQESSGTCFTYVEKFTSCAPHIGQSSRARARPVSASTRRTLSAVGGDEVCSDRTVRRATGPRLRLEHILPTEMASCGDVQASKAL